MIDAPDLATAYADYMGNIVVTQHKGTPIFVRDLGKLKLSNLERHGILGKDEKNDFVEGTVLLLRGENPSTVLKYNANKAANANGGLKWIVKGGGYYSECNKRLKG